MSIPARPDVFLGGSCNPTTWRTEVVIPLLEAADISYYNPHIRQWIPELVDIEAKAKAQALNFLYVIDGETRPIGSMVEVAAMLVDDPSAMYLVIEDVPAGLVIDGQAIGDRELEDLNKGRAYLRDLASKYDVIVHESVMAATRALIADW
jgi:hypothetical protein